MTDDPQRIERLSDWQVWFADLLRELRRAYLQLTPIEKALIAETVGLARHGTQPAFFSPSQLVVIWVVREDSAQTYQLVQIEHFPDRADRETHIYGPFLLAEYEQRTSQILEGEQWRSYQHYDKPFLRALEDRLVTAFAYIKQHFSPQEPNTWNIFGGEFPFMKWYATDISFAAFFDIRTLPAEKSVAELIRQTLGNEASVRPQPEPFNAFGTYSYRPFWIGQQPIPSYSDRLAGQLIPPSFWNRTWRLPFLGTQLIFWRGGLIGVEGSQPDEAIHKLNAFLAVVQLLGIPMGTVGTHDVIQMHVNADPPNSIDRVRSGTSGESSSGGWMPPGIQGPKFGLLTIGDAERAARRAEVIWQDADIASLVTLQAQAEQLSDAQGEDTAAFLFAWTVLERCIYRKIPSMPFSRARRRKLAKFSADALLEVLAASGAIDPTQYGSLMHWKTLRNSVIHLGHFVPRHESKKIIEDSKRELRQLVNITDVDLLALTPLTQ